MMFINSLTVFFAIIYFVAAADKIWWEKAGFYQIYPRSFKDSNGDGIGDLKGIIEKLPYLKEIGITAYWLSPIYKSPMADFGYDISDFRDIQPEYGTMADFEALVKRSKELGLRVILDFVPNHSSDEHEWFKKSVDGIPPYKDYYVWNDGKVNPDGGRRLPPSNWLAAFRGSAWEWNEKRNQYYLHQFHKKQPDLDYRNPAVVEEMKNVLRFWLDKGIDGFRIDAITWLFEIPKEADGSYKDEPLSGFTEDKDDPAYLNHIYTQDRDETIEMSYQWREVLKDYQKEKGGDERVLMTESWSDLKVVKKFFGDGKDRVGAQMPFNFQIILNINEKSTAADFKRVIDSFIEITPKGQSANWVLGNHDKNRVANRIGMNRIDLLAMIELSLPGASVTYNGEEIGMTDVWISWEDSRDPQACNSNPQIYDKISRDPARTPFQWDDSTSAGFSTNATTWLPVAKNYKEVNVKVEEAAAKSHLKIFKQLIALRQQNTFIYGTLTTHASNNVLVLVRQLAGEPTYITLANMANAEVTIDATTFEKNLKSELLYEVVDLNSAHQRGHSIDSKKVVLKANEAFILVSGARAIFSSFLILVINLVVACYKCV
uniref:alpha-glucosidase n=1 Tax=Corethrella appendiculata TaxID=1370023 RepID=U5EJL5_9DIPT